GTPAQAGHGPRVPERIYRGRPVAVGRGRTAAPHAAHRPGRGISTFMALPSTVYKAQLQVADMDRHYYADHALTVACHPSETQERMMVRVLAFALHADDMLSFGRGLSAEGEPDLARTDLTGAI